jgi:hypothetical protein
VLRGYFDESYKDKRVYAIGGYVARDRDWKSACRYWRNRRLKDHIQCFHATDCESGYGEFESLSKETRTQLKTDLIQIVDDHENLGGFGSAVIIDDFVKVRESSDRAKKVLGPSPYFLCFQTLLSSVSGEIEKQAARPGIRVAYIFEDQEEFSGRAKGLYNQFKKINPTYSERLGTLVYASKHRFVQLEMADNLAYETMKEILIHKYDSTRPRRISMQKMIPRIRSVTLWTESQLRKLVEKGRTADELIV